MNAALTSACRQAIDRSNRNSGVPILVWERSSDTEYTMYYVRTVAEGTPAGAKLEGVYLDGTPLPVDERP